MSTCYDHKGIQTKVLRHLDGNELILMQHGRGEQRVSVSSEIADAVEQMIEIAYLSGKEAVRFEIRSKLGLGE